MIYLALRAVTLFADDAKSFHTKRCDSGYVLLCYLSSFLFPTKKQC